MGSKLQRRSGLAGARLKGDLSDMPEESGGKEKGSEGMMRDEMMTPTVSRLLMQRFETTSGSTDSVSRKIPSILRLQESSAF